MSAGRLAAVVITHNRLEQLQKTLTRLLTADASYLEQVVVFDNGSSSETGVWLAGQSDPRLYVIRSEDNLGGAGGFEAAMRACHERFDPDWMVLMDDDARPMSDAIMQFHIKDRSGFAVWAAAVRTLKGEICDMNRPWHHPFRSLRTAFQSLTRGREGFHLGARDYESGSIQPVDGASFVGLFVSRRAIEQAGFPDGRLFLYADDVLYALALPQIGFDPDLHWEHDCESLNAGRITPLWKAYYYHRNLTLSYRQAAGPLLFWPVLALKYLTWRRQIQAQPQGARAALCLLHRAICDGLRRDLSLEFDQVRALASAPCEDLQMIASEQQKPQRS
jgi:GT2 family glycosyltransferase